MRRQVHSGDSARVVRLKGCWIEAVRVRCCAVKNRAVLNRNCVVEIRGGEQWNENRRSVTPFVGIDEEGELDSVGGVGLACERVRSLSRKAGSVTKTIDRPGTILPNHTGPLLQAILCAAFQVRFRVNLPPEPETAGDLRLSSVGSRASVDRRDCLCMLTASPHF